MTTNPLRLHSEKFSGPFCSEMQSGALVTSAPHARSSQTQLGDFWKAHAAEPHGVMTQAVREHISGQLLHAGIMEVRCAALPLLYSALKAHSQPHVKRGLRSNAALCVQQRIIKMANNDVWLKATPQQRQEYANGCVLASALEQRLSPVLEAADHVTQQAHLAPQTQWALAEYMYAFAQLGFHANDAAAADLRSSDTELTATCVRDPDITASIATLLACQLMSAQEIARIMGTKVFRLREHVVQLRATGVWQQLPGSDQALFSLGVLRDETLQNQPDLHIALHIRDEHSPLHDFEDWSPSPTSPKSPGAGSPPLFAPSAFSRWGDVRKAVIRGAGTSPRPDSACSVESGIAVVRGSSPCAFEGPPALADVASEIVLKLRMKRVMEQQKEERRRKSVAAAFFRRQSMRLAPEADDTPKAKLQFHKFDTV